MAEAVAPTESTPAAEKATDAESEVEDWKVQAEAFKNEGV